MSDADPNPVPVQVIPLDYADPSPDRRRRFLLRWSRYAVGLALLNCSVGWILVCFVKVESVLVTGPILFVLGALALLGGFLTGRPLFIVIGAAHCFICVLFTALVNALRWSPAQAHDPFTLMGLLFTAAIAVPTLMAWSSGDRAD